MVNKILSIGDNLKWISYHLDNFISCNLHPQKKRRVKGCIVELYKKDNIIKISDGYSRVYAHLNNKAMRSLSSLESLDDKKHMYPVVNINNFQFQIKPLNSFKNYNIESNKTNYILMLEIPEIELTEENCKMTNRGTDVMKLNSVIELLENSYPKDEKKYNNYYKNINEDKIIESQESSTSNIPLSNPSISSSSKEPEEEGEEKDEEEEEKEEKEEEEEEEEEPLTQISPVRKKKTAVSEPVVPSPIKVINDNISNDISSVHTLPSNIISSHSSIWISNNNKNKNKNNLTPSASYDVLSMLDDNNSNKNNDKNNNNKSKSVRSRNDDDNNNRNINIDDILPRGPDIERNKRNEGKNLNKNKTNSSSKEKNKEVRKEANSPFKFVENKVIDVVFEGKKLKIEYTCVMNLNGKSEKRKRDENENENDIDFFRENYMRKMRRLVENRMK